MEVDQARHAGRPVDRAVDEQGDLVACFAPYDPRLARHALYGGKPVEEGGEGSVVALLRHRHQLEDLLECGVGANGQRRRTLVHAERSHGREHPRV